MARGPVPKVAKPSSVTASAHPHTLAHKILRVSRGSDKLTPALSYFMAQRDAVSHHQCQGQILVIG